MSRYAWRDRTLDEDIHTAPPQVLFVVSGDERECAVLAGADLHAAGAGAHQMLGPDLLIVVAAGPEPSLVAAADELARSGTRCVIAGIGMTNRTQVVDETDEIVWLSLDEEMVII